MGSVYVYDKSEGLLKIVKRKNYCIYAIRTIKEIGTYTGKKTYKFVWNKKMKRSHTYKPYENSDVSDDPRDYISDIKRWNPLSISRT